MSEVSLKVNDEKVPLNDFMEDKQVSISPSGHLNVSLKKPKTEFDILKLSSGEKQILILFIEALLQEDKECIYIADEPEISLHVEWQDKLLKSIYSLNSNAQIIIATHSPEMISARESSLLITFSSLL